MGSSRQPTDTCAGYCAAATNLEASRIFEAGLPAARFPYQTAGCPERLRLWFISKASIWNQSGMTYWRISELNLPELREYARLLQK